MGFVFIYPNNLKGEKWIFHSSVCQKFSYDQAITGKKRVEDENIPDKYKNIYATEEKQLKNNDII